MSRMPSTADADDLVTNDSSNPTFDSVLQARLTRRGLLRGGVGAAGATLFGGVLGACGGGDGNAAAAPTAATPEPVAQARQLGFSPVAKSLADVLAVPAGYTARVLFRLGDPLTDIAAYRNDGTDAAASFEQRAGDHHDGMHWFGLGADGRHAPGGADRGLLCINHESITPAFLHSAGQTLSGTGAAQVRPDADEVTKEILAHGVSVVEVTRAGGTFATVRGSTFNRRITAATDTVLSGPAAGTPYMVTRHSTTGTRTRGTVNNCANGYTPWGTYLACEENWAGYFRRIAAVDNPNRSARELASFARYGVVGNGRHLWATATPDANDQFARWNAMKLGASVDGRDDYRNVPNTFGWNVEIDPFAPGSVPKKRTAMGRFAHEGAWPAKAEAGRPIVYYMGCDSQNEYVYKYVSNRAWDPADATGGLAAGDKYLDDGRLYVARFGADGAGQWVELRFGANGITASNAAYAFADQADVLIQARLAADAAGATKMDRPEWGAVNPFNGEVYLALTNNSSRGVAATDAANPRSYDDARTDGTAQRGNRNGHVVRWVETEPAATTFRWDVYLFGARATADAANVNLSGLTAANDFSSPDGLWFGRNGILWIQTDDGAYTDVTNCMLLAALPGRVGDGARKTITASDATLSRQVETIVGAAPGEARLRRFLVGPVECEVTGLAETPDGRALFVNIQHPGEDTPVAGLADPARWTSYWPDGDKAAGRPARPRSATVVITRDDGGEIGI